MTGRKVISEIKDCEQLVTSTGVAYTCDDRWLDGEAGTRGDALQGADRGIDPPGFVR
jgi:hypothetical protein